MHEGSLKTPQTAQTSRDLKAEDYYHDRYDLSTIKQCLRLVESWRSVSQKNEYAEDLKHLKPERRQSATANALNLSLYMIKGERYRQRAEEIRRWKEQDRKRDEFYQNARQPENIACPNCRTAMTVILKELNERLHKPMRVLFMFECGRCKKRSAYFDDGEPFRPVPEPCPKCRHDLKCLVKKEQNNLIWEKICEACGHEEQEIDDFEKFEAERREREQEDALLLERHRGEFCFLDHEGQEYLDGIQRLEQLAELVKSVELRKKDPDYQQVEKITKWSISDMEKALLSALEKEGYTKLLLDKPEIGKFVIIPFTVLDSSNRTDRESEWELRKLIKQTLSGSNWRLMSEGVSYRLGCLAGRLKGYEREEDLVHLIGQERKFQPFDGIRSKLC